MQRPTDVLDTVIDRSYRFVAERSYRYNHSPEDAIETVQVAAWDGDDVRPVDDYVADVESMLADRADTLDEAADSLLSGGKTAVTCQLDEVAYLGERVAAGGGGAAPWFLFSSNPAGYAVGAAILTQLYPGKRNLGQIRTFWEDIEEQQGYYAEARDAVRQEGAAALHDRVSERIHLPVIGTRHITLERDGAVYRRQ